MSLDKIKEELYKKDPNIEFLHHDKTEFDTEKIVFEKEGGMITPDEAWNPDGPALEKGHKKIIGIGIAIVAVLVFVLAVAWGYYKIKQLFFSPNQIEISLEGPTGVKSGSLATYQIKYRNNNQANLHKAKLRVSYPEDFRPEGNGNFQEDGLLASVLDLGEIAGGEEKQIAFQGKAYSPTGNLIKLKAEIAYAPSTADTLFIAEGQIMINIISAPLGLEVEAQKSVASGDEVNFVVEYLNEGMESYSNISLKAIYPEGFVFSDANPKPTSGNNLWDIGFLSGSQTGKIVITGKMSGNRDETKTTKIMLGSDMRGVFSSYNEKEVWTKIIAPPLTIGQTINGKTSLNVSAGERLSFEINYKNESAIAYRNAIVTAYLPDSPILDYSTVESLSGGIYDSQGRTITWKASDDKKLEILGPGQGGSLRYGISVKEIIPMSGPADKNFSFSAVAKIDSPDIPTPVSANKMISSNKVEAKLNSKIIFNVKTSRDETDTADDPSAYKIHFVISNISNDAEGVRVEAVLPSAIIMTGKNIPADAPIEYNPRTNAISWTVGKVEAGTGIISPVREAILQVKNQTGSEMMLPKEPILFAKDSFTGIDLTVRNR